MYVHHQYICKVVVYKYHTNNFVYKSEGVGAIADWEGKLMMS
jgi:hypothetical protein